MDDRQTFERDLAGVIERAIGPARPVDAMAVARAAGAQSPRWRTSSVFSAIKFVTATAVLVLVGGFVLTGVLPRPDAEPVPAGGASASPEPSVGADLESQVRTDLLPGVELVVEEIEPGVHRVVTDGIRSLDANAWDVAVAADGDVWVEWRDAGWVYSGRPDDLPSSLHLSSSGRLTPAADGQFVRLGQAETVPSSGRLPLRRAVDADASAQLDQAATGEGADAVLSGEGWYELEQGVDTSELQELGFVASSHWSDLRHVSTASVAPDGRIWAVVTRRNIKKCQFEWEACDIVSDGLYVIDPEAIAGSG